VAKQFVSDPSKLGEPIELDLDGETYTFTPTKTDSLFIGLMVGRRSKNGLDNLNAQFTWFANGLNKDHEANDEHDGTVKDCQACRIYARLSDAGDPLTLKTVNEAIDWLLGEVAGRPTT
jgi:hypothetical protein